MIAGRSQLQPFAAATSQAGQNSYLLRQRKRRGRLAAAANAIPDNAGLREDGGEELREDGGNEIRESGTLP